MLKRYFAMPLLGVFLGGILLSASSGYNNNSSYNRPENVRPGVSDDSDHPPQSGYQGSGREEIAYLDERDEDIHERANRKGDWGYKQNWRYDRKAFYKGETQGEAYDIEHPDSAGGVGMDPDTEYLQMHKYYLEEAKRQREVAEANRRAQNKNNRSASNNQAYANQKNDSSKHEPANTTIQRNNRSNDIVDHHNNYRRVDSNREFNRRMNDYNAPNQNPRSTYYPSTSDNGYQPYYYDQGNYPADQYYYYYQ